MSVPSETPTSGEHLAPVLCFDTSALVKFLVDEPESADLRSWLAQRPDRRRAAVALVRTELQRAVRLNGSEAAVGVSGLLDDTMLLAVTDDMLDIAGRMEPPVLRSLDAIHLAGALMCRPRPEAVVTYDVRMISAARSLGLTVAHPGLTLS